MFSYKSEPTFIQTRHFSLDSQVLDFTPTKKKTENTKYQAAINFSTHFNRLITIFWKKKAYNTRIISSEEEIGITVEPLYVICFIRNSTQ